MKIIFCYFKKMKIEDKEKEKAINFLKENKKVKRIALWFN